MRDELQNELRRVEDEHLESNSNTFELTENKDFSNDMSVSLEYQNSSSKSASSQRQNSMPSARSLPFFAEARKSNEETEVFTAELSASLT